MLTIRRRQAGVTLIELMITLSILVFLILVAIPGLSSWIQNAHLRTAAEDIRSGLTLARNEAVKKNQPVEFILTGLNSTGATGWTVRNARTSTTVETKTSGEGSVTAKVWTNGSGTSTAKTVTFTGLGRRSASNADASTVVTQIDVDSGVGTGARALRLTISTGGEIRMCDPAVSTTGDPRKC